MIKKYVFSVCLCFLLLLQPCFAGNEIKIVVKNNAGYPIHHLSLSRIAEEPTVDVLDKPLQDKEAIDIFIREEFSDNLVLWLFDENYSRIAIELAMNLKNIDYIEILNNGSVKLVERTDEDEFLQKKR